MNGLFTFPEPSAPEDAEWPVDDIGLTNTITRTKTRTQTADKNLDSDQPKRDRILAAALHALGTAQPLHIADAVIHGIRVRVHTNSEHLQDFWRDNWFSPHQWVEATGTEPPPRAQVTVYAFIGVEDEPEAAYYSRELNTVMFFNTAYYGQLKSWVLGAVGRLLASEWGIHSIHGACVQLRDKAVLYIAPTGTGKSTSSYGLMSRPRTRMHSDDWVYVRYTLPTRGGFEVVPFEVHTPAGDSVKGYRALHWLLHHQGEPATVRGLTLDNRIFELPSQDLVLDEPPQAYAYISEKLVYLRTNLTESFPGSAPALLHSKLENVPLVSAEYLESEGERLERMLEELGAGETPGHWSFVERTGRARAIELLARLEAFDNARAMLRLQNVFGDERCYNNPLEPVRLTHVMLIKRDPSDRTVIQPLDLGHFTDRLLIGETPDGRREIAYNAYRAVVDPEELAYVRQLEKSAKGLPLIEQLFTRGDAPESLLEEFELFRLMHAAAACYELNTILHTDAAVADRREAVQKTLDLIEETLTSPPGSVRHTLETIHARLAI